MYIHVLFTPYRDDPAVKVNPVSLDLLVNQAGPDPLVLRALLEPVPVSTVNNFVLLRSL